MMASHGRYNKMVPYAKAVDVPLIVRWPKHVRSLCGLDIPSLANGMNLSGHVLGHKAAERDASLMMNFTLHWDFPESGTEWPEWRGVRTKTRTCETECDGLSKRQQLGRKCKNRKDFSYVQQGSERGQVKYL